MMGLQVLFLSILFSSFFQTLYIGFCNKIMVEEVSRRLWLMKSAQRNWRKGASSKQTTGQGPGQQFCAPCSTNEARASARHISTPGMPAVIMCSQNSVPGHEPPAWGWSIFYWKLSSENHIYIYLFVCLFVCLLWQWSLFVYFIGV